MKNKLRKEPNHIDMPPEIFHKLMHMVEKSQEVEYSCDDAYQMLDQYAEAVYRGVDAERVLPLVKHHLDICPDCREEFEALLQVLESKTS